MSVYQKFTTFPPDFLTKKHDFTVDTFKMMLTNVLPAAGSDGTYTDIVEIAAGHGYPAGGMVIPNVFISQIGLDTVVLGDNVVFLAAGGSIGPFQHAVMYNSVGFRRLVAYWSYPTSISLLDTETLTVTFSDTDGIFKIV